MLNKFADIVQSMKHIVLNIKSKEPKPTCIHVALTSKKIGRQVRGIKDAFATTFADEDTIKWFVGSKLPKEPIMGRTSEEQKEFQKHKDAWITEQLNARGVEWFYKNLFGKFGIFKKSNKRMQEHLFEFAKLINESKMINTILLEQ